MSNVYVVSYDLSKSRNYTGLHEALKGYPSWWHYLDSTWLIISQNDSQQVYRELSQHIDPEDKMLVMEAGKDYYGWISEHTWQRIERYCNNKTVPSGI